MSNDHNQDGRGYVAQALARLGSTAPPKYAQMLEQTPVHHAIKDLDPWFFLTDSQKSVDYCSKALGRPVLPFAQAVEQDMMACFETEPSTSPAVVIINPWAQDEGEWIKKAVEIERLPDFDAWLTYAEQVSREVRAREQEEAGDA